MTSPGRRGRTPRRWGTPSGPGSDRPRSAPGPWPARAACPCASTTIGPGVPMTRGHLLLKPPSRDGQTVMERPPSRVVAHGILWKDATGISRFGHRTMARGKRGVRVPLSEDEQRILSEIEAKLYE